MELFNSFFIGGFDCDDSLNSKGERTNLLSKTGHDKQVKEDYTQLAAMGITTVREGICWSQVEKIPYVYDFTEVARRIEAARQTGIEQLWDICHGGFPQDIHPLQPEFAARFAALCRAFARFYHAFSTQPLQVVPINDITTLAARLNNETDTQVQKITGLDISSTDFTFKYYLCKAAIAGIRALKEEDHGCRIILAEPLTKIHPRAGEGMTDETYDQNERQFEVMDMIGGYICPELGGHTSYMDILGFTYYSNNQWEHKGRLLKWPFTADPHAENLATLLLIAYNRYNRPLFLAATGHHGRKKAQWIKEVTDECIAAMCSGIDFNGICIYPIIETAPKSRHLQNSNAGLWHTGLQKERVANRTYIQGLGQCKKQYDAYYHEQIMIEAEEFYQSLF